MFMTNISSSSSIPTYFELYASSSLISSIKPAFIYGLNYISNKFNMSNISIYNNEIFYILLYLLENHYLNTYNASFEENFYNLKRVSLDNYNKNWKLIKDPIFNENNKLEKIAKIEYQRYKNEAIKLNEFPLNIIDKNKALFTLVMIPYLKGLLDDYYNTLIDPNLEHVNNDLDNIPGSIKYIRKGFKLSYPYIHALYELTNFIYQLMYLFENSKFFSPLYHLLNQRVKRMTTYDMIMSQRPVVHTSTTSKVLYYLAEYAKWGILLSLFGFRFYEWWRTQANTEKVVAVIPPETIQVFSFQLSFLFLEF